MHKQLTLSLVICTFLILDLSTLIINKHITNHVISDASSINLIGRQRMRSQRITKALSITTNPYLADTEREMARQEAANSYTLFKTTLRAFSEGGTAVDSDGQNYLVEKSTGKVAFLIDIIVRLTSQWPVVPENPAELENFYQFMQAQNLNILNTMEEATNEFERQSIASLNKLQLIQSITFGLSFCNFLLILNLMYLSKQRAEKEAVTDPLTRLLNRGGIYQEVDRCVEEFKKSGKPFSLMLLDLDDFKNVNDKYGHFFGDEILKEVAQKIMIWIKPQWVAGRLGGDEFVIICPGVAANQIEHMVADLSKLLSNLQANDLLVSASVGSAYAEIGANSDSIIAKADSAMYATKNVKRRKEHFRSSHR